MKNIFHELHMRYKIWRILRENRKHPERCFDIGEYVKTLPAPGSGEIAYEDMQQLYREIAYTFALPPSVIGEVMGEERKVPRDKTL